MTPQERCDKITKMLKIRTLEIRGDGEGEKGNAGRALDKLLRAFGAPDMAVARKELDAIQGQLNRAGKDAKLVPQPPRPPVQVFFVQHSTWSTESTDTTASTTGWGW